MVTSRESEREVMLTGMTINCRSNKISEPGGNQPPPPQASGCLERSTPDKAKWKDSWHTLTALYIYALLHVRIVSCICVSPFSSWSLLTLETDILQRFFREKEQWLKGKGIAFLKLHVERHFLVESTLSSFIKRNFSLKSYFKWKIKRNRMNEFFK